VIDAMFERRASPGEYIIRQVLRLNVPSFRAITEVQTFNKLNAPKLTRPACRAADDAHRPPLYGFLLCCRPRIPLTDGQTDVRARHCVNTLTAYAVRLVKQVCVQFTSADK